MWCGYSHQQCCHHPPGGAVLLEQVEHWQLEGRRMFSAKSMTAIPALDELTAQPSLQEAEV